MENDKNKLKQIANVLIDSLGGVFYVGLLSFIGICVAIAFKNSEFGNLLEIKDFFNFAGSFGGAILGGFISLIILKVTLKEQRNQFENQRKIEDIRRKEDKEQFERQLKDEKEKLNKEYNIKIINDRISNGKEVFIILKNIITVAGEISYEISNTDINEYNKIYEMKKYNDSKLLKISDLINEFDFYIKLFDNENIDKYNKIKDTYNNIYDNVNLLYKDINTKKYYDNINCMKKDVIDKIYEEIDNIDILLNNIIDYCQKLNEEKYKE